ncbi:MAG: sulfatase [Verrucomicrobiia bacterium]
MRTPIQILSTALLCLLVVGPAEAASSRPAKPNIVLIFADDMGYGDLGCYGSKTPTPNLDRLAAQGVRFTDFYVGQAVCSASRAALMTGCYPNRIGIQGALGPKSKVGLNANDITIAEILKAQGYATAIYGKWHLGDAPEFLPTRHGFDDYFGLPYSNDMWPFHPTGGTNYPPLPLIEGDRVVQLMPDQTQLTTWYTERAVKFIEANKERPFFLYVPHSMPHVPLYVSDKFKDKSGRGLYADVIMEMDWSTGEIVKALREHGLEERTIVIFTSDNGPWLSYGDHAGSAGPLREGKGTTLEGGQRVPCIIAWPGVVPAGATCRELAGTIDVLPTLADLAGAELSRDHMIDGRNIWPLISRPAEAKTPHEAFFYYWGRHLQAVRSGQWKLHFPHDYASLARPGSDGKPGAYAAKKIGLELFDLANDIGETKNVADANPEVVKRLETLAEQGREDLGDSAGKRPGKNVREPGRL